jgi:hypothetical protein
MTASVIRFPARRVRSVRILHGPHGWLVAWRDRGWLHGTRSAALADAREIAAAHGVDVLDDSGETKR